MPVTRTPSSQSDPMPVDRVRAVLDAITGVRIAVCGDFCLDAYWMLDPRGGEVSAETGLHAQAVGRHYYSLGGAANVVANVVALAPASVRAIGVVGDDVFGREMLRQLRVLGVDIGGMSVQAERFDTVTYGKRVAVSGEEPRLDFGFFNQRSAATDAAILGRVRTALQECDVVIFNQQIPGGLSDTFLSALDALFDEFPHRVVVCDSRHYGDRFTRVVRKTNEVEAARLNGASVEPGAHPSRTDLEGYASALHGRSRKPVFITRGPRGILTIDRTGLHDTPGIQLLGKTDTVGAGDTVTSALALCLGAGVPPAEAAAFANLAATVTVQKLFQTGTASPAEVLAVADTPDYVYQPELAHNVRHAVYVGGSEIEQCCAALPPLARVRHAVFDHDGTISTLRQGWERIMEPVMLQAILGAHYRTADESLFQRVEHRVREYIDKSTGIETLIQMAGLRDMVIEFGLVPRDEVLDPAGYKAIYNAALMDVVNGRVTKFRRGELALDDLTVKGAVGFLRALRARGITLYLASGTDRDDVRREARELGYADLFDGGIYGATGDIRAHAKREVMQRILVDHRLDGSGLVAFGDGPVELRESRRRDGTAIGIASDEVRRYGLDLRKRTRVIEAGAHLVMPDFSQADRLLALFETAS